MPALLASLTLLLATAGTEVGASPPLVGVLPTLGAAGEEERRDIDAVLPAALVDEPAIKLFAPAAMRQQLASLENLGLVCRVDDYDCFVKVGILTRVTWVVVPTANRVGSDELELRLEVIDVGLSEQIRSVSGRVRIDDRAAVRGLLRRSLGLEPLPSTSSGSSTSRTSRTSSRVLKGDSTPTRRDAPPVPRDEPSLGTVVAGTGAAVAGGALLAAVTCDLIYSDILDVADPPTRKEVIQPLGASLWIAAGAGAVVLATGLVMMVAAPEPDSAAAALSQTAGAASAP